MVVVEGEVPPVVWARLLWLQSQVWVCVFVMCVFEYG